MPPALLASQLATLERPAPDEPAMMVVDGTKPVDELLALVADRLRGGQG
jgi:gluconate kinase